MEEKEEEVEEDEIRLHGEGEDNIDDDGGGQQGRPTAARWRSRSSARSRLSARLTSRS